MPAKTKLQEKQIYHWIAKGCSPEERLNCAAFKALDEQDEVIINDRLTQWISTLGKNRFGIEAILAKRNQTMDGLKKSIMDVEVIQAEALPLWAKNMHKLLMRWSEIEQQDESYMHTHSGNNPAFTCAWSVLAFEQLQESIDHLEKNGIKLHEKAIHGLTDYLTARLYTPVMNAINSYFYASGKETKYHKGGLAKEVYTQLYFWQKTFDAQPALVAVIGEIYTDWFNATEEMLLRLNADKALISEHFFHQTSDCIEVQKINCGLGDPHRGGRSVAIIESNLGEVVYKPKNLLGTQEIVKLLEKLHVIDASCSPLAPEYINKVDYGWEQKIAVKACQSIAEIERFYTRLGGWLRLLQFFSANDFWYDNLIAHGDLPYFIDYETVVGFNFGDLDNNALAKIGILPLKTPNHPITEDAIDIGCLIAPGMQKTPLKSQAHTEANDIALEASHFAAYLHDEFMDINDYFASFQEGFIDMNKLLLSVEGKHAVEQFLHNIKQARFRHIFIDTWSAYQMISTVNTLYKTDGVRRAIAHDNMFSWLSHSSIGIEIIESAIKSVRRNDVPIYEIQADSRNAYTAENVEIKNAFPCTPIELIRKNFTKENHLPEDIKEVRALFSIRQDAPLKPFEYSESVVDYQPMEIAMQIAQYILSTMPSLNTTHTPSKVKHIKWDEYVLRDRVVDKLDIGFDGLSALILFFAKLYKATAQAEYKPMLDDLFASAVKAENEASNNPYYGLMNHRLAMIYALGELSQWYDVTSLINRWVQKTITQMSSTQPLYDDYALGIWGLLDVLQNNHLKSLIEPQKYQRIVDIIEQKPWQRVEQNSILQAHLSALFPTPFWGRKWVESRGQADVCFRHKSAEADTLADDTMANLNVQICLQQLSCEQLREQLNQLSKGSSVKSRTCRLLDELYTHLLIQKYYPRFDNKVKELSLSLINRYTQNDSWFSDDWAEDSYLLSARHGLVDIGLAFLAQENGAEIINPARLVE